MTRLWWICFTIPLLLSTTAAPAVACTCARIAGFQERIQSAPVVAVGRVVSVGETPPEADRTSSVTIVRPAFMGAGVTLAIVSVAKGEVSRREVRVWDLSYGECFNTLQGLTIGASVVVAMWPVADTPAAERATWGAASLLAQSDYLARGACGASLQVLTADEVVEWTGRKIQ
jgi:hypothetical protein